MLENIVTREIVEVQQVLKFSEESSTYVISGVPKSNKNAAMGFTAGIECFDSLPKPGELVEYIRRDDNSAEITHIYSENSK